MISAPREVRLGLITHRCRPPGPVCSRVFTSRSEKPTVIRQNWLLLAESYLTKRLFAAMMRRIEALPGRPLGPVA